MQDEVKVSQADRNAASHWVIVPENSRKIREGEMDWNPLVQAFARHRHQAEREEEEAHKIGISEGRQEMVREIDLATGGDGEFRWSTEPDRHCPCEEAMKARVIERFHQAERETLARMEPGEVERLRAENETARDILGNLSSYLGAGMGDDNTTPEQFDARIRWGIDHIGRVYRDRAAQVVEECSKRPCTTWGEVKRAILDDTCLPIALPPAPEAGQ